MIATIGRKSRRRKSAVRVSAASAALHYPAHRALGGGPLGARAGVAVGDGSSQELKSSNPPLQGFLVLLLFAAFWNGILYVIVSHMDFPSLRNAAGNGFAIIALVFSGFQTIMLIPFGLIGLVLIVVTILQFLAIFGPRIHVTLVGTPVVLGSKARIQWTMSGRSDRIDRLTITLEGHEIVQYASGGNDRGLSTSERVFRTIDIADTTQPMSISAGQADFAIPADTMHSFKSDHNSIAWTIHVKGKMHHWTDLDQKMTVEVGTGKVVSG
jgi:hypothetical protein